VSVLSKTITYKSFGYEPECEKEGLWRRQWWVGPEGKPISNRAKYFYEGFEMGNWKILANDYACYCCLDSCGFEGSNKGQIKINGMWLCARCGARLSNLMGIWKDEEIEEIFRTQAGVRNLPQNKAYIKTQEGVWRKIPGLHKEVVAGTLRIMKYLAIHPERAEEIEKLKDDIFSPLYIDLRMIANEGRRTEEANLYFFHSVRCFSMNNEDKKDILSGNQELVKRVWDKINIDLKLDFCCDFTEPEPIDINSL
jgi:hypothetical protein